MQGRVVPGKRARRGVGGPQGTFFGTRGHRVHRSPRRVTVAHRPPWPQPVRITRILGHTRSPSAGPRSGPPIAPCRCVHPEASRGGGQRPWWGSRPISRISPLCARVAHPRRLGRRGPGAGARRDRAGRDERRGSRRRAPRRCRSGRRGRLRRAVRASAR